VLIVNLEFSNLQTFNLVSIISTKLQLSTIFLKKDTAALESRRKERKAEIIKWLISGQL
jgi:hypothetical protein